MSTFIWKNLFQKKENQIETLLKNSIIFQDLNPLELKFVLDFVHLRHFRPGESIFREGEVGVGMYFVMNGSIDLFVEKIDENRQTNEKYILTLCEEEFFGEISLIEDSYIRTATAKAKSDASLLGFFQPDLKSIMDSNPEISSKILFRISQIIGKRLTETARKITELKQQLDHLRPTK